MLIYRVETEKGAGPYVGYIGSSVLPWSWHMGNGRMHPSPRVEGCVIDNHRKCAFESLDSLYQWFYCAFVGEVLIQQDYVISVYEVDEKDVCLGGKQLTYRTKNATLVERHKLDLSRMSTNHRNPYLDDRKR